MVHKVTINIIGTTTDNQKTDKFLKSNVIINVKTNIFSGACQITIAKVFTKFERLRVAPPYILCVISNQKRRIHKSLALSNTTLKIHFFKWFLTNLQYYSIILLKVKSYKEKKNEPETPQHPIEVCSRDVLLCSSPEWDIGRLILRSGDVEVNPGPATNVAPESHAEIGIITYNARGLKD